MQVFKEKIKSKGGGHRCMYLFIVKKNIARLKKMPRCPPSPKKCSNALKKYCYEMEFIQTNKESQSVHLLGRVTSV